jgi:hypothetical protein
MSDKKKSPKQKKLTDEEKSAIALTANTIKNLEASVLDLQYQSKKNEASKMSKNARALKKNKKNKRAAEKKRYSTEISKLATLGKPTQILKGLSDTTKIPKNK